MFIATKDEKPKLSYAKRKLAQQHMIEHYPIAGCIVILVLIFCMFYL